MGCIKLDILDRQYKKTESRESCFNKKLTPDFFVKPTKTSLIFIFLICLIFNVSAQQDMDKIYIDYAKYADVGRENFKNFVDNQRYRYFLKEGIKEPSFKDSIYWLSVFQSLDENGQKLIKNVDEYKNLISLEIINLQEKLPDEVLNFPNLNELYLQNAIVNDWDTLFKKLGKIKNLKSLRINLGNLEYIPEAINNLKHLERLEIINVPLIDIDDRFTELTNLKYLSISNTELSFFPTDYQNDNLIVLALIMNRYNGIPEEIQNFKNLESFTFSGNIFYSEDFPILCKAKKLKVLELEKCGLEQFPKELLCLPKLEMLFIGYNRIIDVPKELVEFTTLRLLDWSNFRGNFKELEPFRKEVSECYIQLLGTEKVRPIIDHFTPE
jgi:Leucine-rich repeat (LRR) protein